MAKTSLRSLIDNAISSISIYKTPDISEAREQLDRLIRAAGLGGIADEDKIIQINYRHGNLNISTQYYVRNCLTGKDFHLPEFIIDADNPVFEAQNWRHSQAVASCQSRVSAAKDKLQAEERALNEALDAFSAFSTPSHPIA